MEPVSGANLDQAMRWPVMDSESAILSSDGGSGSKAEWIWVRIME